MDIDKEKISSCELTFSITAFIQGSFLYILFISPIAKHDSWLVVFFSLIITIESFPSRNELLNFSMKISAYGPTPYTIIFPILGLLIAKIRFPRKAR